MPDPIDIAQLSARLRAVEFMLCLDEVTNLAADGRGMRAAVDERRRALEEIGNSFVMEDSALRDAFTSLSELLEVVAAPVIAKLETRDEGGRNEKGAPAEAGTPS